LLELAKAEGRKEAEKAISHVNAPSKRTKIDHRPIKTEPLDDNDVVVIEISDDESLSTTGPVVKEEKSSCSRTITTTPQSPISSSPCHCHLKQ
jgi:predicted ThiF/HesA family dinucleotide-utilizing enzyme